MPDNIPARGYMKMYKVVIIDDEPRIVEGLTKGMEWEKWNCKVVGTAENGEKGITVIRELKPDILITDISMPGLDGLGMIAALKSEFPDMQITILTGFREFDYAKRAIELGVTRFLLKPSKFAELEEAISVMCSRITEHEDTVPDEIGDDNEPEISDAANSFIVNSALEYMKNHYQEKMRLVDVANEVYVSQWHLSKLLNKITGQNFSELLNAIRMEKASELLRDPSLRISDIAEQVGFVDLAHFSRVFKKVSGMSANEYRNKMKL